MQTCHEIHVYFIIKNTYKLVVSKFFEENWFQFLDDSEILWNTKLIKPNDFTNNFKPTKSQLTTYNGETYYKFLDIILNKTGIKTWMDIYNKPT